MDLFTVFIQIFKERPSHAFVLGFVAITISVIVILIAVAAFMRVFMRRTYLKLEDNFKERRKEYKEEQEKNSIENMLAHMVEIQNTSTISGRAAVLIMRALGLSIIIYKLTFLVVNGLFQLLMFRRFIAHKPPHFDLEKRIEKFLPKLEQVNTGYRSPDFFLGLLIVFVGIALVVIPYLPFIGDMDADSAHSALFSLVLFIFTASSLFSLRAFYRIREHIAYGIVVAWMLLLFTFLLGGMFVGLFVLTFLTLFFYTAIVKPSGR